MTRRKIDPLDLPAPRAPRSFWGLCGHCIKDKRVRSRRMMNGKMVNVCDGCFRGGKIAVSMAFEDVNTTKVTPGSRRPRKGMAE